MSKLSERQRLILTIAISVLFTGGLVALILKDRGEIESTEKEIASLDARIQAADAVASAVAEVRHQLVMVEVEVELVQ